jgi:hypothetical protein
MSIDVQAPDGSAVTFPDGTPADVITNAMQVHFGKFEGGAPAPAAAPAVKPASDDELRAESAAQFFKGVPILGAGVDKAGAALQAAAQPLTGAGQEGGTYGERYTANLKRLQDVAKQFETEHPIVSTATQLGGGLAATAPLAATGIGAKVLGLTGKSLPAMVGAGGTSGAIIGAADSAARGQDIGAGAALGGAFGALAPPIGRAIGGAVQGVKNLLPAKAVPQNIVDVAGSRVPLSSGQASGDVATQMMENTALRGGEGQGPQKVAEQFFHGEQAPAVEAARGNIGTGLDRFGQNIVDNPQAAGELVSESVKKAEQAAKQNYGHLYDTAMAQPGEIHAGAFEGIGQKIKGDLSLGRDPVIVDDVTTPIASRMLQDVDNQISQLKVQNRADPFGAPNPQDIVGINLAGVDQTRKRLISMASATERGSADQRAARRVIGAFDDHVDNAMSNGLFTGDDKAIQALKDARAAYSDYRKTFRSQGGGDDVGRAMEKITGRNGGEGATPTEVANYLYGTANVGGTGLSTRLAQRIQGVVGADSPEWSGVRQGLWSRLTSATEGRTEMGPQKASERIYEFLNGSGKPLSQVMFSPAERTQMEQYAALLKQLVPKPGTVNYSNTAPVLRMLTSNALKGITVALGAETAGPVGALAGMGLNAAGKAMGERSASGRVARSLYGDMTPAAVNDAARKRAALIAAVAARGSEPALMSPNR